MAIYGMNDTDAQGNRTETSLVVDMRRCSGGYLAWQASFARVLVEVVVVFQHEVAILLKIGTQAATHRGPPH